MRQLFNALRMIWPFDNVYDFCSKDMFSAPEHLGILIEKVTELWCVESSVDIERAELPPHVSEGRGATFRKMLFYCREDFFNISNLSNR
jgi:hypothetical protein